MSDTKLQETRGSVEDSLGGRYAIECIEKLQEMAAYVPTGVLANNVSSHLPSCADSIAYEIDYLEKKGRT